MRPSDFRRTFLAALLLCMLLMAGCGNPESSDGYTDLTAQQAHEVLSGDSGVHVLDIRTPDEFLRGHLKGARNINFYKSDFKDRLAKLDREKTWLVYCRTGNRSGTAMHFFKELGFKHVLHLKEGIRNWSSAGYPVHK